MDTSVKQVADAYNHIRTIRSSVETLHKQVIGLFRPHPLDEAELVLKNDNGHLMCASFSPQGNVSTLHINAQHGVLVMFDEGVNLTNIHWEKLDEAFKIVNKK